MPRNGAGLYTRSNGTYSGTNVWDQDAAADVDIESARHDVHDQDLADAVTASLAKDGQTSPSANLPMAGFRHSNVGAAANRTDYARASQVQDGAFNWVGTSAGSSNAYTGNLTPAPSAVVAGMIIGFIANHTNTGAATFNLSSTGAVDIKFGKSGAALPAGAIQNGGLVMLQHTGTFWLLLSGHILGSGLIGADLTVVGTHTLVNSANNEGFGMFGGSSNSETNGAGVEVYGITNAATGKLVLSAGDVANGTINFRSGAQLRLYLERGGDLTFDASNGGGVNDRTADVAGAGANQAAATALAARYSRITSGSSNTGVRLPSTVTIGGKWLIRNRSGSAKKVYPASGHQIDSNGTDAAVTLQDAEWIELIGSSASLWEKVSLL